MSSENDESIKHLNVDERMPLFVRTMQWQNVKTGEIRQTVFRVLGFEDREHKPGFKCVWCLEPLTSRAIGIGEDPLAAFLCAIKVAHMLIEGSAEDSMVEGKRRLWWVELPR